MRTFRTSFLVRLSVVAFFLIGFLPGHVAVAAQTSENSHTNELHNVTITWTDDWEVDIPPDVNGTLISMDQANSIFFTILLIESSAVSPEEGVWFLFQEGEEIVEDNSSDDPPSASWVVEGTGILRYAESYLVNDGETTVILLLSTVPIMQATGVELVQSQVTINGNLPLTGSIVGDTDDPEDLTGVATTEPETRSSRTTRGSSDTPEATAEVTEESTRSTRTTRGTTETSEATEEAAEESRRTTRGTTEIPEATEEATEESRRTTRGTTEIPEATEEATEESRRTTRGTTETPEVTEEVSATEEATGEPREITRTPRTGSGTTETPEPTEEAIVTPTEEASLSQQMDTFTGSVYGYTISFHPNIWQAIDVIDAPQVDGVRLDGASSTVFLIGTSEYGADPVGCLVAENDRNAASSDSISDWEVATGGDGEPLWFESDSLAWGVFLYTFTSSSGEEVEFVDYISCETIPGQDAVLIVQLTSLPDEYNDNLDAVLDILDTLEFRP